MMRKLLRPILALALAATCGLGTDMRVFAAEPADTDFLSGFGNSSYGSQMSYDAFNYSIRKRFESVRIGSLGSPIGGYRSSGYNNYAPGPGVGYNNPTPGYNNPSQGYSSSYGSGYNPGYNNSPSGYNPGYNPGYAPQQGYNPGYNPQGFNNPGGTYNPAPSYNNTGYNNPGGYNTTGGYNTYNTNFGSNGYSLVDSFASDSAYAMAPSSRASSVASARRRQLDCVYYSGFTAWADIYQTWARQRSTNGYEEGYEFRTTGPAIGFDWTSGPVTVGAAMTYNWGKLSGRDISHEQKISTWGITLYGQYNSDNFYVNGTLGYGHSWFDSQRKDTGAFVPGVNHDDDFTSNSVNIDAEFGWKIAWSGFSVIPNVGIRFFHDRRGNISENNFTDGYAIQTGSDNYHVLEIPIGVNFAYEINTGGMVFVPRGRLAWVPELARNGGGWSGTVWDGTVAPGGDPSYARGQNAANRSRHGFQIGLGMEAKITKSLSAHVDYTAMLRSRQYEHHWNLGMGFSF